MRNTWFCVFLLGVGFIFSCVNKPEKPDVTGISIDSKVLRFENDLFAFKGKEMNENDVQQLKEKYGLFFDRFVQRIIRVGKPDDPSLAYYLASFVNDESVYEVYTDCEKKYRDFSLYEKELQDAFKFYKYYLSEAVVPAIYTFVSGFNYAIAADDSMLAIGLDMYLGKDCKYYPLLGLPGFKIKNMQEQYIVSDAVFSWLSVEFEEPQTANDLIGKMVHFGKLYYALKKLLPDKHDTLLTGFSAKQLEWCKNNEKEIWAYFVNNNLFFSQEQTVITKFMGDAPFTPGFPEGSPGRVGHWLGWQIVKNYVKQQPDLPLSDLMKETDYHKIFNQSKYKP